MDISLCILSPPATPILEDNNSNCSTSSRLSEKNSITVSYVILKGFISGGSSISGDHT